MEVVLVPAGPADVDVDLVAVAASESSIPAGLPTALTARLEQLLGSGDLQTDVGSVLMLHLDGEIRAPRLVVAGVGPVGDVDGDVLRTAAGAVAREVARFGGTIAWGLDDALPLSLREQTRALVEGTALGGYDPARWKTDESKRARRIQRLTLTNAPEGLADDARRFAVVASWTNHARDLVNMPPNLLTPVALADEAERIADLSEHLSADALGPEEARALGMGAFLAVAAASANEPRMITLRYDPPNARADLRLGLIGKAITFDSGGLSIKPPLSMPDEKGDMAGGAAVLSALGALAELGVPVRCLGIVAAAENVIGDGGFRPSDIITAMNGKTIEIVNTDAEGRLVLADALCYAHELDTTHLVDLATLTGPMTTALGDLYAGLFANDDAWRERIGAAATASGDHAWPWPLHPRYRRYIDSDYADMKNSSPLREGVPVLAAEFLHEFVDKRPWAHLDIAGTGFLARSRGDYLAVPGGTGYGVRLIVELAVGLAA